MQRFLKTVITTAGHRLSRGFRKGKSRIGDRTTAKDAANEYDHTIDQFIIREITKAYPDHNILTEESGFIERDSSSDWLWIVDPLDGTGNFSNGNPLFSVCIAVMNKNELRYGAVFAPVIDELYIAKRGRGSFKNSKRIHVSSTRTLDSSYALYCEGSLRDRHKTGRLLSKIYPKVQDVRKLGSAGIETAWVAAGQSDFYFTSAIESWDVAAGVLLIEEAGGKVTDTAGNAWRPERDTFLFSNGTLHEKALSVLKK